MRAVVYDEPRRFSVRDLPIPLPQSGEVRVRVIRAGICGTDHHLHEGEFDATYPLTPGHEIVGVVDTLGPDIDTDLVPGQLVVVDNRIACLSCRPCVRGETNLCRAATRLGVTAPGGFAEYVCAPAYKCLDATGLTLDQASLAEPLSCAVHAIDVLGPVMGKHTLVLGSGPAGLLVAQMLRAAGAVSVVVAAPTRFQLDLARDLGATGVVQLDRDEPAAADRELASFVVGGFDRVVDTTGQPTVINHQVRHVADGGTLLLYGMADPGQHITLPAYEVFRRELVVRGSFSQAFSFSRAIELLRGGDVRDTGIVTHRFPLEQFVDALAASRHDRSCIKAVVEL